MDGQSCSVMVCDERAHTHNDMHLCLMRSKVPPWKQQLQTSLRRLPSSGTAPPRLAIYASLAALLITLVVMCMKCGWYTRHIAMEDIQWRHTRQHNHVWYASDWHKTGGPELTPQPRWPGCLAAPRLAAHRIVPPGQHQCHHPPQPVWRRPR